MKTDLFGRSPIYYSIIKRHQICTDAVLSFLISIDNKDSIQFRVSFFAIRNDFNDILKNSSKLLPKLLNKLLLSSDYIQIPELGDFPIITFHEATIPHIRDFTGKHDNKIPYIQDFTDKHDNKIPAIIKYAPFPFPILIGSKEYNELLKSIIRCNNQEIFKSSLIQFIIDYQWSSMKKFAIFYTFLM